MDQVNKNSLEPPEGFFDIICPSSSSSSKKFITYSLYKGVTPKAIMGHSRHKSIFSLQPYNRNHEAAEVDLQDAIQSSYNKRKDGSNKLSKTLSTISDRDLPLPEAESSMTSTSIPIRDLPLPEAESSMRSSSHTSIRDDQYNSRKPEQLNQRKKKRKRKKSVSSSSSVASSVASSSSSSTTKADRRRRLRKRRKASKSSKRRK